MIVLNSHTLANIQEPLVEDLLVILCEGEKTFVEFLDWPSVPYYMKIDISLKVLPRKVVRLAAIECLRNALRFHSSLDSDILNKYLCVERDTTALKLKIMEIKADQKLAASKVNYEAILSERQKHINRITRDLMHVLHALEVLLFEELKDLEGVTYFNATGYTQVFSNCVDCRDLPDRDNQQHFNLSMLKQEYLKTIRG